MKPNLNEKFYEKLNNIAYFKTAKVNGITIEWKDGEDIDPNSLYENSIKI